MNDKYEIKFFFFLKLCVVIVTVTAKFKVSWSMKRIER